jgi:hypothetical protein
MTSQSRTLENRVNTDHQITDQHDADTQATINTTIQQSLHTLPQQNHPFGDLLCQKQTNNTFRLYLKNINGIYKANKWDDWSAACKHIAQFQIDACGVTETNLKWNMKLALKARQLCQKHTKTCNMSTSCNNEPCRTNYQPGGTATIIIDKVSGRISNKIVDSSGMGRWSGFSLLDNTNKLVNVITAYRPTKSDGLHTSYQQQSTTLKALGRGNTDPRTALLEDLEILICNNNKMDNKTILMIDANEGLFAHNSKLPTFLANTNMTSLVQHPIHYPATHNRGSQCIDFVFGSVSLSSHVIKSGILPFFEEPWPVSDHRGIFVDFCEIGLFGASIKTPLYPPTIQVTSLSRSIIQKFVSAIESTEKITSILNNLQTLQSIEKWTQEQHNQLEDIEVQFTNVLLHAEKQCAVPVQYPWSTTLH